MFQARARPIRQDDGNDKHAPALQPADQPCPLVSREEEALATRERRDPLDLSGVVPALLL